MMGGFFLAIAGLLLYMRFRYYGNWMPTTFSSITIAGFVLYFLGRVLGVVRKKADREQSNRTKSESDGEDN